MSVLSVLGAVLLVLLKGIGILLLVLIGFSGIAYINSHFFVKIFDKYIPEETSEPNPDSVVDHSLDSDNKNL